MRASSVSSSASPPIEWSALLADAGSKPGVIHSAYQRFWNYSTGNQLLAWFQCASRKLDLGPINTFLGWIDCGRHVKKGEKAKLIQHRLVRWIALEERQPTDRNPEQLARLLEIIQ